MGSEEDKVNTLTDSRYGFRYDPMTWAERSESIQAASVRVCLLNRPKTGDKEMIEQHLSAIFADQGPDGTLRNPEDAEESALRFTGRKLREAFYMGLSPSRVEAKRALDALEKELTSKQVDEPRDASLALAALALGNRGAPSAAPAILNQLAATAIEEMQGEHDPGAPHWQLGVLWESREMSDQEDHILEILTWVEQAIGPPGPSKMLGLSYPWEIVEMAGTVTHPIAGAIARKLLPMLLRSQNPGGGWKDCYNKDVTELALRMLVRHNLLEPLRELEPLPADWRIARSIHTPCERPQNIAFHEGKLWVLDAASDSAIQVSLEDGTAQKTVRLAKKGLGLGFAASEGFFYTTTPMPDGTEESPVYELSIETGELIREMALHGSDDIISVAKIGRKLVLGDGWRGGVWLLDLDDPNAKPSHRYLATSMPDYLASDGESLWCVDWFWPVLVKTNLTGEILEWGERPFGFNAVAVDNDGNLWALDSKDKRVCMIERSGSGRKTTAQTIGTPFVAEKENTNEVVKALAAYHQAEKKQDVEKMIAAYSESYSNSDGADRSAVRRYFEDAVAQGVYSALSVDMKKCDITMDGNIATATPVIYESPTGKTSYSYRLRKESDGVWRIINSEQIYVLPPLSQNAKLIRGIDAMEAMETNEKTPNTTMAAFALALQTAGEELTYEYLMGISGSAFRFQLADGWSVTSTISHIGYETETNGLAAIPYEISVFTVEEGDIGGIGNARREIAASIDKGIPAVYRLFEDGLIIGYDKAGETLLCVHPQRRLVPHGIFVEERWPSSVFVFGERKTQDNDIRKYYRRSLELAVDLFEKEKEEGKPLCGERAWSAWIEHLSDDWLFKDGAKWIENWWLYLSLYSSRKCAGSYLQAIAKAFPDPVPDHLLRAAQLYETMAAKALLEPSPDVAPCPFMANQAYAPEWSKESRLRQIDALKAALELERKAIQEIRLALEHIP